MYYTVLYTVEYIFLNLSGLIYSYNYIESFIHLLMCALYTPIPRFVGFTLKLTLYTSEFTQHYDTMRY